MKTLAFALMTCTWLVTISWCEIAQGKTFGKGAAYTLGFLFVLTLIAAITE